MKEMGDRTPSQFYRDLTKSATSAISDNLLLTLWKNRLPATMRPILTSAKAMSANDFIEMGDRIHQARLEEGRLAAVSIMNTSGAQRTE
jgi:hypothetical protein